jgi:hypothetical protein
MKKSTPSIPYLMSFGDMTYQQYKLPVENDNKYKMEGVCWIKTRLISFHIKWATICLVCKRERATMRKEMLLCSTLMRRRLFVKVPWLRVGLVKYSLWILIINVVDFLCNVSPFILFKKGSEIIYFVVIYFITIEFWNITCNFKHLILPPNFNY